jgi:hypothetical protein
MWSECLENFTERVSLTHFVAITFCVLYFILSSSISDIDVLKCATPSVQENIN